jgi:Ca2+/Na+ antiporter
VAVVCGEKCIFTFMVFYVDGDLDRLEYVSLMLVGILFFLFFFLIFKFFQCRV